MSQEIRIDDSGSASVDDPSSQTPVESSGVSCVSSPAGPAVSRRPNTAPIASPASTSASSRSSQLSFLCEKPGCKKVYKTKTGYEKHIIAHNVSDAYSRMPSTEQFSTVIHELTSTVLDKLLNEHRLGPDAAAKVKFVEEILKHKMEDVAWLRFISAISNPLIVSLSGLTKLLPENRYVETQQKLNDALNDDHMMAELQQQLQFVSDSVDVSDELARKLVFRIAFLLLDQVQIFIAKEMQGSRSGSVGCSDDHTMSDVEKHSFKRELGSLFRAFLAKGLSKEAHSKMWRSLCRCLKEMFVVEPVSNEQFLNKELWYNTDEEISVIIPDRVLNFFFYVESIIRLPSEADGGPLKFRSLDDVIGQILNNREAMDIWFVLTHNFFSEESSIYVLKLIVSAFREVSTRLEEKQKNCEALEKSKSSIALRTNLKRD